MARPKKSGMDYFPHDTDARNNLKIRKLRAMYGNNGYATYFILLENIYRNKNYSLTLADAETTRVIAKECGVSAKKLIQIINKCIELELFNSSEYLLKNELTSQGILRRTEPIEKKRIQNSNLQELVNSSKSRLSRGVSVTETTQSKVKESKVKESKVKEIVPQKTELETAFDDYKEFRRKIRKPITDKGEELLHKELNEIADNEETKIKILNQSIINGWQGVFPLRPSLAKTSNNIFSEIGKEKGLW